MTEESFNGQEVVTTEYVMPASDADKLTCLAMEQGIDASELTSRALALYAIASETVADSPNGMFVYVTQDGGYVELTTGVPGEASEDERPLLEE